MRSVFAAVLIVLLWMTPAVAGERLVVVVFGDSLVAGHGIGRSQAFPSVLEVALRERGYDVKVVNAGVSGDTTNHGLQRVERVLEEKPDLVILELGINDVFEGRDLQQIYANLQKLIDVLKSNGTEVLLAGMKAPPQYEKYQDKFVGMYGYLAQKNKLDLYPFFLEGVAGVPQYNNRDGAHPNPFGVQVMVKNILPYVEKILYKIYSAKK